jgi:cell wall-associated NlpC family hydrolase
MRNASPSQFVQAECKAVGLRCIAQPSGTRPSVARDVPEAGSSQVDTPVSTRPSSWTTFQRLAQEVGYLVFETGNVVYFGKPSWLIKVVQEVHVTWPTDMLSVPTSRMSRDSINPVEMSFEVPWTLSRLFRPGKAVKVRGLPLFSSTLLITEVSFSLAGTGPVSVSARSPIDPVPGGDPSNTIYHGVGQYASVVEAAINAGFKNDQLTVAVAIALAESGGRADAFNKNSNGTSDYGLWQINSVHKSSGFDTRLAYDPDYNAKWAYRISSSGNNFGPWATYWEHPFSSGKGGSGAPFQKWMAKAKASIQTTTAPTSVAGATKGSKQVNDFVGFALAQSGDQYIFGVEDNLDNPDPNAFDCSELTEWCAHQAGVYLPDGSINQLAYCQKKGTMISLTKAINTRGALLFHPGHVAISLGDGRTIEAMGRAYGVRQGSATGRFTSGALVPGLNYGVAA